MSNYDRLGFASKLGGLLAAAGSAVGLGNIWRFPTQAGQNGGAAFFICPKNFLKNCRESTTTLRFFLHVG